MKIAVRMAVMVRLIQKPRLMELTPLLCFLNSAAFFFSSDVRAVAPISASLVSLKKAL